MDNVGERVALYDGKTKVTGEATFVGDMKFPGMLYGKVLRSPYAHALIKNIDISQAQKLHGVKIIITFNDIPQILFNGSGAPDKELIEDQLILNNKVRFVGDAVAAVAATSHEIATKALELIKVDYEILPAAFTIDDAMADKAPIIHGGNNNIVAEINTLYGDMEKGFNESDYIFEDSFVTSKVSSSSLEPCGISVASFKQGRLTVWSSTQMPFIVRGLLAKVLNLPLSKVRVIKPFVGGGFGSRLGVVNEHICALLAMKSGMPVRLEYSREESLSVTESRHPVTLKLRTGVTKDGRFAAREMKAIVDTGAYATHGPFIAGILGTWFSSTYRCENIKYEGLAVYTNTVPSGGFRGYGSPQVNFAVESQIDIIAKKVGWDPIELRLKNYLRKGDTWKFTGWSIESDGLQKCIELGMEKIAWKERVVETSLAKKRGKGMAISMHSSGARPKLNEVASVYIKLNEDGTANVHVGSTDSGQGSNTTLAQIAAESIGIKYEDVVISGGEDTDVNPYDAGSHASRQAYSGGYVVKQAGKKIKEKLLYYASHILPVTSNNLEVANGWIRQKNDHSKKVSVAETSRYAHIKGGEQILAAVSAEPPGNPPVYGAQFAEVEVDMETGQVTVIKVVACHDVGKAINPTIVEGQIDGAIQQGIGYALTENLLIDSNSGKVLNSNLSDYKILFATDMPKIEACIVEAPSQTGAYGVKSVGESGLVPTAAAIANAIAAATGERVNELPMVAEKVLSTIK